MKIGIMGGTFDPIHIGHLLLGQFAYENFNLDEIWYLPNGNPPHKVTDETDLRFTTGSTWWNSLQKMYLISR